MPAKKGTRPPNAGKGRVAGVPNKATTEFRQTVQALLDDNRDNVKLWLSEVAEEDPAKALDLLAKLAEFAAPKLSRAEHTGPEGGPMQVQILDPTRRGNSPAA